MKTKPNWVGFSYLKAPLLFTMKTVILFFTIISFGISAEEGFSQKTKIKFETDAKLSIDEILDIIKKQTDYNFIYRSDLFEGSPDLQIKKGSIRTEDLLRKCSSVANFDFTFAEDGSFYLMEKPKYTTGEKSVQQVITGTATDADGVPLSGANIVEKGTTNGVTADFDGNFSIEISDENAILVISYVGYATKEFPLNGQKQIDAVLDESAASLDEVVVVGYGTQKRSDVTGAVASVKGVQIAKQGTVNATQALQGQVSGVTVVNSSGRPGAGASVLIRGQGSYGADIDPLYILDGAITSGIDFVNPNDIESIEVLKDASAAAIYGSRAANGVVIVTTKRGKSGKPKVGITINSGIQTLARKLDFATSQEWRDKEFWKFQNEGVPIPVNLLEENFDPSINTDWQDVLFGSAIQRDYNVQFSGGGEGSNFNFSLGFADQDGILVGSEYERINLRLNSDFRIGKFKVGESLSINRISTASSNPFTFQKYPEPIFIPQNEDGSYNLLQTGWGIDLAPRLSAGNPLADIELTDREDNNVNIVANVYGQFEIVDGLTLKTSVSTQYNTTHNRVFVPAYTVQYLSNPVADLSEGRGENYSLLWENTINYSKAFGKHSLDVVAGWTRQFDKTDAITIVAEGFPTGISVVDAAETILPGSGGNITEVTLESYLARLNYSFDNKYQLTATIRQDASSRLIKELRTGTFPSFSAGWVVSNESFFPQDGIIDRLKFRGGYGELGRLNAVGPYQVQNTLQLGGDPDNPESNNIDYILGAGQVFSNGVTQTGIINQNLLWERAQSSNIAMEASLFNNKLALTAEYFVKNTKDLQFGAPLPLTVGTNDTSILVNAGNIQNKGFEFTLGYNGAIGDFSYNVSGNFFALKNEVLEFRNPDDAFVGGTYGFVGQDATRAEVGTELSNFWLLRTDGFFNSQEEVDAYSVDGVLIQPNASPGDLRFKDINGDGQIDNDDKEFISGSIPDFEYGFNFNGSYKNFDLSFILQGVVGQKIFNGVGRSLQTTLQDQTVDYWREDNLDAQFFRPSIADPNGNSGSNDFFLENAGYLRLRNVQLGYNLPQDLLSKFGMDTMRITLTGQNLLTFTEFTGYDPENISFGLGRGVNTNIFPLPKTVLVGLTLSL